MPSLQRSVSSLALTHSQCGDTWLFDCGEGTYLQYMRSLLKLGRISKIFITHLHGDHIFGLPGMITSRSMGGIIQPLTLYGPKGIKLFMDTALLLSSSHINYPLEIIEIEAGLVLNDRAFRVSAWPLVHSIHCFGYRIEQHDKPGFLDAARLQEDGVPRGPWYKHLKEGETVTLEDGRVIKGMDYLGPVIKGKTLAIFGDTAPTPIALQLAANVDLMVHEATLEASLQDKANKHGHSTTLQAVQVAKEAGVKRMIATHFSSRYMLSDMPRLLEECRSVFPNTQLAYDLAVFTL